MNGVTPFVSQCRQRLVVVRMLQQNVRMNVVRAARHVSARGLAHARKSIHPARSEAAAQLIAILFTQRSQSGECDALGGGDLEAGSVFLRHQRRIIVVIRKIAPDPQHLLPQAQVAMQGRQRNIGLLDQGPIYLRRHVVGKQGDWSDPSKRRERALTTSPITWAVRLAPKVPWNFFHAPKNASKMTLRSPRFAVVRLAS